MEFSRDPYIDEDGEALMDPDAPSPPPEEDPEAMDPYMDGGDEEEDAYRRREDRSPTPVHDDRGGKPKKRLIKKSGGRGEGDGFVEPELNDWDDEVRDEMPSGSGGGGKKKRRKEYEKEGGREKVRERRREKGVEVERRKGGKVEKGAYGSGGLEEEEREMWNTVAGEDSEV